MLDIHQQQLLSEIANLMDDKANSDFKITCQGHDWQVHRNIISEASAVLAGSCRFQTIDGSSLAHDITLFNYHTVGQLVSYIYRRTYDVTKEQFEELASVEEGQQSGISQSSTTQPNINDILLTHVEVYGIADYFQIDLLKSLAAEKFAAVSEEKEWEAHRFIDVVKAVNGRSGPDDRRLRNVLRDYAMKNCTEIVKDDSIMTQLAELEDVQDFAVDMFRQMVQRQNTERAEYEKQLRENGQDIAGQMAEIASLQDSQRQLRAQSSIDDQRSIERIDHITGVMEALIHDLQRLPAECPNARCERSFDGFKFERKGHTRYGRGEGRWTIKCKCKAALN